jgi:serine/threonine-protein kinase
MGERAEPDRLIGDILGNYRILRRIGRGGMGVVYLAEHEILRRKAAVKVLLAELSGSQDLVRRFFTEARTTAQLRHSAFVEIFDSGRLPDGSAYLVMEYLRGESLAAFLERCGPLPWARALAVARDIAEAMGVAHRHGIIHRDLKPDNVFLSVSAPDGGGAEERVVVKVLDFGIAKLTAPGDAESAAHTRTGLMLGTPLFMAPEQCRGRGTVDRRADIYALGCMMHAMLTGNPPFPLDAPGEVIAAHLSATPPPLSSLGVTVPAPLEALVLRMLEKDPARRPADAKAVIAAIDNQLVGAVGGGLPRPEATSNGAGPDEADQRRFAEQVTIGMTVTPPQEAPAEPSGGTRLMAERRDAAAAAQAGTKVPSSGASGGTLSAASGESGARLWSSAGRRAAVVSGILAVAGAVALMAGAGRKHQTASVPAVVSSPPRPVAPVAVPAPAQPPAPAPPPRMVAVAITSAPSGATVVSTATGAVLGSTPLEVKMRQAEDEVQLVVKKTGYQNKTVGLSLKEDAALKVTLEKKPAVAPVPDDSRRKL